MAQQRRDTQPLHDPRMLRAIAHPVRNRVLHELSANGSLRAADVARALDIPANQASFHLRQLAKYGLVEEDPDAARDKRDRVWKLVSQEGWTANLGQLEQAPGGPAAVQVFRRNAAAWGHTVVDAAFAAPGEHETRTFRTVIEEAVRLSKEEAEELAADLDQVLARWVERTRGRGAPEDDRRTYLAYAVLQPHPAG